MPLSDDDRKALDREVQQVKAAKYVESADQVAGCDFEQSPDGQGFHFHELSVQDRKVMTENYVVWSRYMDRGLTWEDQNRIIAEAALDPQPRMPEMEQQLTEQDVRGIHKEVEEVRFPGFRERLFDDPAIVAQFPEPAFRERFLRQMFDRGADEEFREIAERPGDLTQNLLAEYYIRSAEGHLANDNLPVAGDGDRGLDDVMPGDPGWPTPAEMKELLADVREEEALRHGGDAELAAHRERVAARLPDPSRELIPSRSTHAEGPTAEQLERVSERIADLSGDRYRGFTEWKNERLLCEWYAEDHWDDGTEGTSLREWKDLDSHAIYHVLGNYVDWAGFAENDMMTVINNVIEGRPPIEGIGQPQSPTPDPMPRRADPLDLARQRAREAAKEPGRDKDGPEIG